MGSFVGEVVATGRCED
jgi:hypothetical protein